MPTTYDEIGRDYARLRRSDPRIGAQIAAALGDARSVINVGAGSGSYEPVGIDVTAVEPSQEMIDQRPAGSAPAVMASAEKLPFNDKSFDAAMAVLTLHHWDGPKAGLHEMRRVARGPVVLLTFDPAFRDFWLYEYVPELAELDDAQMPSLASYDDWLGPATVQPVPIPHDCADGFLCGYWRRPEVYLDATARRAMSSFWKVGDVSAGLRCLADDLESGRWEQKYGHLRERTELDCGYRLVIWN